MLTLHLPLLHHLQWRATKITPPFHPHQVQSFEPESKCHPVEALSYEIRAPEANKRMKAPLHSGRVSFDSRGVLCILLHADLSEMQKNAAD